MSTISFEARKLLNSMLEPDSPLLHNDQEKPAILRGEHGHFLPGSVANRSGRPPSELSFASALRAKIYGNMEAIVARIALELVTPKREYPVALLKEALDRIEGKVPDRQISIIMKVGDEYASNGMAAARRELEDRKARYAILTTGESTELTSSTSEVPIPTGGDEQK